MPRFKKRELSENLMSQYLSTQGDEDKATEQQMVGSKDMSSLLKKLSGIVKAELQEIKQEVKELKLEYKS